MLCACVAGREIGGGRTWDFQFAANDLLLQRSVALILERCVAHQHLVCQNSNAPPELHTLAM